mgnify:CR=1 FL=1
MTKTYEAVYVPDAEINLDGLADEPAWEQAHLETGFSFPWEDRPVPRTEFRALFDEGTICTAPTVYVCAQDRAGTVASTGPERLFFLVNAPARPHGEKDIATAEARVTAMLDQSGVAVSLDGPNVARFTPNDFAERFPGTDGAIYGWPTHGMLGSFRRQGSRSRVAGLYLAGGSVHPGPGVPMAAISGRLAAASIQKDCG